MQKYALIVAGGSGTRMRSQLPKQFISVKGKPILMHTLETFHYDEIQIILVLPKKQMSFWQELCQKQAFFIPHQLVEGGNTRFESVANGLACIKEPNGLVAIHDGVRPCIERSIINTSFNTAKEKGNAVVSVPLKDSIRKLHEKGNTAEDRSAFRLIQTPQTFQVALIREAFEKASHQDFTDDASVLESMGEAIHLIDGDYRNIKITTPEDLLVAESYLDV